MKEETTKVDFTKEPYKKINKIVIVIYILFMLLYVSREYLYKLDNKYITLIAGIIPNLIPSFLFTLIGLFYIIPFLKGTGIINKSIFLWLINVLNISLFLLLEYIHVIFNLGSWDNNDIVASLIGTIVSTIFCLKLKKNFTKI